MSHAELSAILQQERPCNGRRIGNRARDCNPVCREWRACGYRRYGVGLIGRPASALYIAAKHGVVGITKAAAIENAALGVRVNAVCPGIVETGLMKDAKERADQDPEYRKMVQSLQPIGRWAQPDELAQAVLWLCSDGASFMTGHPLVVDGGYSIQ